MFDELQKDQRTHDVSLNTPRISPKVSVIKEIGGQLARLVIRFHAATGADDILATKQVVAEVLGYSLRAANLLQQKLDDLVPHVPTRPHWAGLDDHVGYFNQGLSEFEDMQGEGLSRIRTANLELVAWCHNAAAHSGWPLPDLLTQAHYQAATQPA